MVKLKDDCPKVRVDKVPMGKAEIAEKVAARQANLDMWQFIRQVVHLLTFWPLLVVVTVSIVSSASQILLQDLTVDQKVMWIITQNWPSFLTWIVVYYGIRRTNKFLGW